MVPARALSAGFLHRGRRLPFRSQQGIFRPREMQGAALSIATVVPSSGPPRYDDEIGSDDAFVYRYRDNGPHSHDNRILRAAFQMQVPIVYFRGILPSLYAPLWPCFVTGDDPGSGFVRVEVGVRGLDLVESGIAVPPDEIERRYVVREVKARLHQQRFRQVVLRAYRERCTVCRLHEPALLQAAHIVPDRDVRGEARVPNGLSLCAIHHGAFDRDLMTITPDYAVRLSRRLLDDQDGPMLEQGLKAFHGQAIHLPRRPGDHPSRELLEERVAQFERAA